MTGSVVPIGIFDGVHRGHQLVVQRAKASAQARDAKVVVVTFHPHPVAILRPRAMPLMLTTIDRRVELLKAHGADEVVVLEFSHDFSLQSAEDFISETLQERLSAVQVVVGANFRFGHRALGDVDMLRKHGLEVDDVELLRDHEVITSTYIRSRVAGGDVASATHALGRPHLVEGPVVRGEARGRDLGFPTANVGVDDGIAIPADGIYAGWLVRPGANGEGADIRSLAAISIGTNPTFNGQKRQVEAYVIDEGHDLDLYDQHVVVEFADRLRGMERFDSIDALVAQMTRDVDQARIRLH